MSVSVLVLGIVISGAGLIAMGFAIPTNDLDLRHTLIVAGTTALVGGLVLVGLAAAVAELRKIVEAVRPRAPGRGARAGELKPGPGIAAAAAPEVRLAPRAPEPKPAEARPPEMRAPAPHPPEPLPEPRLTEPRVAEPRPAPAADATLEVSASAIERLRSSLPRNERPKPGVVATAEEVPLSPNGANGAHPPRDPEPAAAKSTNGAAHSEAAVEAKGPGLDFLFRSKSVRPAQPESFDTLWPKRPPRGAQPNKPAPAERPAPAPAEKPPPNPAPAAA